MDFNTTSNETALDITNMDEMKYERENRNLVRQIEEMREELFRKRKQLEAEVLLSNELEDKVKTCEALNANIKRDIESEKSDLIASLTEKAKDEISERRQESNERYLELNKKYNELLEQQSSTIVSSTETQEEAAGTNKCEVTELKEEVHKVDENICSIKNAKINLDEKIKYLEQEHENMRESIKCKSDIIQEKLCDLEEMRNEKALLSNKIAILKSEPVEDLGRGNCLFAELEDKRVKLERKLTTLNRKLIDVMKMLSIKTNELEKVKRENRKFKIHFLEDFSDLSSSTNKFQGIIDTFKEQILKLDQERAELEQIPDSPEIVTNPDSASSNLEWIHILVNEARTESNECRKAICLKAREKVLIKKNICFLMVEKNKLILQSLKEMALIEDLQMESSSKESTKTEAGAC